MQLAMNDYGKYQYKITQEMVDATKAAIAAMKLKKPAEAPPLIED